YYPADSVYQLGSPFFRPQLIRQRLPLRSMERLCLRRVNTPDFGQDQDTLVAVGLFPEAPPLASGVAVLRWERPGKSPSAMGERAALAHGRVLLTLHIDNA